MSIAKINSVTKAKKDQGDCESCKKPIKIGDGYIWWIVGYRSTFKHKRCLNCKRPKQSQLESNDTVANILSAGEQLEDALAIAVTVEDIKSAMNDAASCIQESIGEWEDKKSNLESAFTGGSPMIEEIEEKIEGANSLMSDLESFDPGDVTDLEELREEALNIWESGLFI